MDQPLQQFQRAEWYRATSLTERLELLRSNAEIDSDPELGERYMQLWRRQPPFGVDGHFERRLRADGTTEDEFRRLLAMSPDALGLQAIRSSWLTDIATAYAQSGPGATAASLPAALQRSKLAGFLNVLAPLIRMGGDRLRCQMQPLVANRSRRLFDPRTIEASLLGCLPGALLRIVSRTLVLELNLARVSGALTGSTPEERFESFVKELGRPEKALALLLEYPVLARQATTCIENWVTCSLEFLRNLCADWQDIRTALALDSDPGPLEAVDGNLGDRHRGGRSVLRARFSSGCEVIYKPRSLAVDVHFQELLAWLNDRGAQPSFQTLPILDRGSHGWVRFVRRTSCSSPDEIRRFFQRHGSYLAVLYALEATDFHHENLIAAGEHPMLLDLEALFHPRVTAPAADSAAPSASDALSHSIMRIGLLPERVWSDETQDGIDISGIGAAGGQLSPDAVPQWEHAGTDTMRFTRKRVVIPGGVNRPLLNGVEVDALGYTDAIASGFTSTYELLLEHRAEFLSPDGPLARFADDEVRVIIRPTRIYAKVLEESFHPDLLRDALDRERFFDRLWVGLEDAPHLVHTIRAERHDLNNVDVPLFTTRPGSRHLWTSGHEQVPDVLPESALASVRRRVETLSPHDLETQRWFIRASLSTLSTGRYHAGLAHRRRRRSTPGADRESMVAAARVIGERLDTTAVRSDEGVSWIGLTPRSEHRWSVAPLDIDLYGGLPGVALFLAYLGSITQEDRYAALARTALSTALRRVNNDAPQMQSVGAFTGWGGLVYALCQLGMLWNQPDLLAEAHRIVAILPPLIESDRAFDIVEGAAGCIGSLLALHACAPCARTLEVAARCGDRLVSCAQPMPRGVGWVPEKVTAPLAGFAHGAAGVAWALLKLAATTGEKRFRATALAAIAYERSLFSPEAGNWADLRPRSATAKAKTKGRARFMTAWCHGAAGIGLARTHALGQLDDVDIRAEVDLALETTVSRGLGGSHCLCHGDLGNLELLWHAGRTAPDARWDTLIGEVVAAILQDIDRHGYPCGSPSGVETPGLMTGLAGIGYGLCALHTRRACHPFSCCSLPWRHVSRSDVAQDSQAVHSSSAPTSGGGPTQNGVGTMSTPYQLATMIETVAPRLHPALVCRDNVESILAIARVLPTWQCAGFECRLGDPAPRADFGVHLRRTHGISIDEQILARETAPDTPESDAWQRLRRFADAWSERRSVIAQAIPAVSLEFDVHSPRPPRVAAPSIFFSMRFGPYGAGLADSTAVDACSRVVRAVLDALGVDVADARHQLEQCFRVLLPRVSFLQLGVWLARPVNTFRICAPGLKLRDIRAVVKALKWSGPHDTYESHWRHLLQFSERGALHLDVGHEVAAKIGIEVNFAEASASLHMQDPEDTRFFDYLVEHDMCLPEKRDGLLSWVGGFRLNHDGGDAATAPLFLRTISHVKFVFEPEQNPQAKAYLAVGRIDDRTEH